MNKSQWLRVSFGFALLLGTGVALQAQQGYGSPPPPQQNQNYGPPPQGQNYGPPPQGQNYGPPQGPGGWDAPPPDFSPMGQQGFRDGIRAAREDQRSGRPMFVTRNYMYRHPPVPGPARNEYRDAFQRGYDRFLRRHGEGPPPPPPGQYYPH